MGDPHPSGRLTLFVCPDSLRESVRPWPPNTQGCIPVTWFTPSTGHLINILSGMNVEGPGSIRSLPLSKYPRSYSKKLTSQIWSSTSRVPTIWSVNMLKRLILRFPRQMRPQRFTRTVRFWYGYSGSGGGS